MIEFIKNNQKNITMGGAIALLIICFFQQKELAKLRAEKNVNIVKEVDLKKVDSLKSILIETKK
jgi:hypothetical protein